MRLVFESAGLNGTRHSHALSVPASTLREAPQMQSSYLQKRSGPHALEAVLPLLEGMSSLLDEGCSLSRHGKADSPN